jgi:Tfp pilus assembly protein PilO
MLEILASGHHPHAGAPSEDLSDIPLRLADLLFNQASLLEIVMVCMVVALGYYIHVEGKSAKKERSQNQEKFESLIIRAQDTTVGMASDISGIHARLDNIEREIESQKDYLFKEIPKLIKG